MIVVIGLDSIDAARIKSCHTPNIDKIISDGEGGRMDPGDGLTSDELITQVLWPSLLAGRHPKELFPSYYESQVTETKRWDNPLLDRAISRRIEERLARILPREAKEGLKRYASKVGFSKSHIGDNQLEKNGSLLDTAKAPGLISIPGVNEDSTNADLKRMISPQSGTGEYQPTVDMVDFERACLRADSDRLIRTLEAVSSRQYDFLMSHFFSVDLVQHVWADTPGKMERWYGFYDDFVGRVRDELDPDDVLVVISDHGMETSGIHSRRAFYACSKQIWDEDERKLPEFRGVIETELVNHTIDRDETRKKVTVKKETRDHLEHLGYF